MSLVARISPAQAVAQNVSDAIVRAGVLPEVVARAVGLTPAELKGRLEGDIEFSAADLVKVGGFLHVWPTAFLEGAAA